MLAPQQLCLLMLLCKSFIFTRPIISLFTHYFEQYDLTLIFIICLLVFISNLHPIDDLDTHEISTMEGCLTKIYSKSSLHIYRRKC